MHRPVLRLLRRYVCVCVCVLLRETEACGLGATCDSCGCGHRAGGVQVRAVVEKLHLHFSYQWAWLISAALVADGGCVFVK